MSRVGVELERINMKKNPLLHRAFVGVLTDNTITGVYLYSSIL
jgi:hypothetical protein